MQLSQSNEVLKFNIIEFVPNDIGGFAVNKKDLFTVFGKVLLTHVNKKNQNTYEIKIKSRNDLSDLKNKKIVISNEKKHFIAKEIFINKKLTIIKCNDYTENSI